ncbi:unnamed protein product [Spirodela intermedia]|uniref:Uncharacterized protein n=1 Tax=Spirodela intermedia TaxID=51605 RepID=A0A7I8JQL0_SPIIN|nr:unnamed protein product [Spirodela intermedia]CAA6672430.1 unnamed protein product [Spirodela intermedia]
MEAMAMSRSLLAGSTPCANASLFSARSCSELPLAPFLSVGNGAPLPSRLTLSTSRSPLAKPPQRPHGLVARCTADVAVPAETVPIEKRFEAFPTVMDINQIRDILPHRFPFLLVDRVIEYKPGVTAVGIKNVTINDNFFPGHFPERPIMPGVLMVEAMAQVGGLVMLQPEVGGSRENFFFPVIAGDTLVMRMTLVKLQKRFGIAKMEGKAFVGGDLVCEGEFLMATGTTE